MNTKGLTQDKRSGKWIAQPTINGQRIYLGTYGTREEAETAINERRGTAIDTRIVLPQEQMDWLVDLCKRNKITRISEPIVKMIDGVMSKNKN